MNRAKDFSEDLQAISANVENEVGRYVKLLRHETTMDHSSESAKATRTKPQQEMKGEESATNESAAAPSAEPRARAQPKPRQKGALVEQVILENVTTRLHRETNELLTEAALRQKLKKEKPDTRQEIIEEALRDWFRKHGYSA